MWNSAPLADAAVRRASLTATLAALLGLPLPSIADMAGRHGQSIGMPAPVATAVHSVTTCVDDANLQGSLRYEVLHAANNEIIDMTPLEFVCSKITLASQLEIPYDSLVLQGPGSKYLTIASDGYSRVFHHTGNGTLLVEDLTVENGYYVDANRPWGGCIYSHRDLYLVASIVAHCTVESASSSAAAEGGGIFANGSIVLNGSTITDNLAESHYGANAFGGGLAVHTGFTAIDSSISANNTRAFAGGRAIGGGLLARGSNNTNAYLSNSVVSENSAGECGGAYISAVTAIRNSTISSNSSDWFAGLCLHAPLVLANSTIALNTVAQTTSQGGGGVWTGSSISSTSSIIADNVAGNAASDVGGSSAATLAGSDNLIVSSTLPLPIGTLRDCPRLGPLAYNGGPTRTHALVVASPAVDHGSAVNLTVDQRGEPRVAGAGVDIGAFELQPSELEDRMFASGFDESCNQ